jgi:hypothetical protein
LHFLYAPRPSLAMIFAQDIAEVREG